MRLLPFFFVLALLSGCFSPYKVEVPQGNIVTQEMAARLKPGMSRDEVRHILGTPLLTDIFHPERWDYVYRLQKGGKVLEERRFTVIFENDRLAKVEGDVIPDSQGAKAWDGKDTAPRTVNPPKEEKGFFDQVLDSVGF